MHHVMKFEEMYMKDLQIEDLLQYTSKLKDDIHEKENQYSEYDIKIKDITEQITLMNKEVQSEKQILETKNKELSKHLDSIADLEIERNKHLEENKSLESQRHKLKAYKRNMDDQALLDQGQRKYNLYKEITRIHWDYEELEEHVKGYVCNKIDYIHHFCYPNESTANLSDQLWEEIHKSVTYKRSEDTFDKQNK